MKIKWPTKKLGEVAKLDLESPESLMQFLKQPTLRIAEFLTGILVSDKRDWKLSAGHLIQAIIKGNLFTQLGDEIKKYRDSGVIKNDFLETDINRASFKELLEFIDSEAPDETRFKAMKSIFFSSLIDNKDEELAHELMKICRGLSSMEILILSANYDVVKGTAKPRDRGIAIGSNMQVDYWAQIIAEQIGHHLPEIIMQYENHLIELRLISDRHYPIDRTRISNSFAQTQYFRLTTLGYRLCEFITKYEK